MVWVGTDPGGKGQEASLKSLREFAQNSSEKEWTDEIRVEMENIPGRGKSICKDSKVRIKTVYWKNWGCW